MRKVSIFGLIALLASVIGTPAWSQSKIAVAYIPSTDFVPLLIAQDQGIFAKHGLDVSLTMIQLAANMPAALTSHSIDVGVGTMPPLLLATENGLDFVVVSGYTRNLASDPQTSLMIRTGVAYTVPADLKGKKIVSPGLLSSFDIHFRKWLTLKNVPVADLNFVEAGFPQMSDMLRAGTVDGAIVIEPFRSSVIKSGSGTRAVDFLGEVTPNDAGAVWIALREWADAHPTERAAFRASLEEGVAAVLRDKPAAEAVEQKYLKFVAPMAADWSFDITPADIQFYEDMMHQFGILHKDIDPASLIAK